MQLGAMRPIDPRTRRRRRGPATSPELQHPRAAAARGSWARGLPALGVSLLVLGPLVAAPGAGAADQGPYRGRVVDAVTGQPLADAVAIVVWEHEHPEIPGQRQAGAVRSVLTDVRGEFTIDGGGVERDPREVQLEPRIVVWKPGYTPYPPERRRPPGAPATPFAGAGGVVRLAPARDATARVESFNTFVDAMSGFGLLGYGPPELQRLVSEELRYVERALGPGGPGERR